MLFFIVAATVTVTTFLMLTAWKKLKRRRRIRFRTPPKKNGWNRMNHSSDCDGGKIPLMTLNHFQDDVDDEEDEDFGLGEDEVEVNNGAVNGGRHSFT